MKEFTQKFLKLLGLVALNLIFNSSDLYAQSDRFVVSGYVRDAFTQEAIVGAKISISNLGIGTVSNAQGAYSLAVSTKVQNVSIQISATGFKTLQKVVVISSDLNLNFELSVSVTKDVEIFYVDSAQLQNPEIGVLSIPMAQIKNIPSLGGEPDILKAFQLMPGVQGGQEGSSGIYVRGGTPDQNLFLLDDVPLYNVNHIGGFFSTFDANTIESVKLYKGGFPAQYAGRLSSVMDIRVKEGNSKKHKGELAVGLLTSKINFEGPLGKDSSMSYLVSARRFNLDLFIRPIARVSTGGRNTAGYTFYDLSGKFVKQFKNGDRLSFTIYEGRDRIFLQGSRRQSGENGVAYSFRSNINWGNFMSSLSYSKQLNPRSNLLFSLSTTNFRYSNSTSAKYSDIGSNDLVNRSKVEFISGINDVIGKVHFESQVTDYYQIKSGISVTGHRFTPGKIAVSVFETDSVFGADYLYAAETNTYFENHLKIGKRISINAGLNFNSFFLKDTTFMAFQPRFMATFNFNEQLNLQIGYSRMTQNLHYLANSGVGMPSDVWLPATKDLVPEISNQYNLGLTYKIRNEKYPVNFVIEGFYKDMRNLIDYKDGVTIFSPSSIMQKILLNGTGIVYGAELLIQKSIGRLTGWVGYTWSKNTRQFDDLNFGNPYPFVFDRRHELSVVLSYKFKENIVINASWVYMTGNAITLGQGNQLAPNIGFYPPGYFFHDSHMYNGKNGYRLPSFHKLDFSVSFTKRKTKGVRTWNFGVYNAYNRNNPLFLFYQHNNEGKVTLHQLTLFPIIPSLSYSFIFDTAKFLKRLE